MGWSVGQCIGLLDSGLVCLSVGWFVGRWVSLLVSGLVSCLVVHLLVSWLVWLVGEHVCECVHVVPQCICVCLYVCINTSLRTTQLQ